MAKAVGTLLNIQQSFSIPIDFQTEGRSIASLEGLVLIRDSQKLTLVIVVNIFAQIILKETIFLW